MTSKITEAEDTGDEGDATHTNEESEGKANKEGTISSEGDFESDSEINHHVGRRCEILS